MEDNFQFSVSSTEADDHVKINADSLASSLRESMPENFSFSRKCCIFKIPNILQRHNPEAFVPKAFSIGPWHHGQGEHLKQAEEIKLNYLRRLISRFPVTKLNELIQEIGNIEKDVRAHYAGPIEMPVDDFVKLLVIDGCFIIEVFRRNYYENWFPSYSSDEYDPIIRMSRMTQYLYHDLILLENQIPWLVLEVLFNMTKEPNSLSLEQLGIMFFRYKFTTRAPPLLKSYQGKNHILDLLRESWVSLSAEKGDAEEGVADVSPLRVVGDEKEGVVDVSSLRVAGDESLVSLSAEKGDAEKGVADVSSLRPVTPRLRPPHRGRHRLRVAVVLGKAFFPVAAVLGNAFLRVAVFFCAGERVWQHMPSAQRLKEAGIKFKKGKTESFLDVKFVDGVLEVPSLLVDESTEDIFRNLLSFEQCYSECPAIISSYAVLIGSLSSTEKDLKILCEEKIIDCWLNPEVTTQFFNKLYHNVYLKEYYYVRLCEEVNEYRNRSWPRLRAWYLRNFLTPWAIASQFAAVVILILTFLQTLFSITR